MNLSNTFNQLVIERYLSNNETKWMWVSPDDNVITVPKLNHKGYIMRKYKDKDYGWDYDRVFDEAIKDGWVRVIYEYYPQRFKGELSLNGYNGDRVKHVLKHIFGDLLRYGNKSVYIDYEHPNESHSFSTFNIEGKQKLFDYMNS